MSELLNGLKVANNITYTTNGALTYNSTMDKVYDLFATGAAMRGASDEDCMNLFANAYREDRNLALKCLFYLRDCRGQGQGERRFFRVAMKWLAVTYPNEAKHLVRLIPEFGRWDDLYCLVDTKAEEEVFKFIHEQLVLDVDCGTPSLLAKWLKSENTSSKVSRELATKTRQFLGLDSRTYRHMLSLLRGRINIVETLMSQNRWDEIEFNKIPSRAGLMYKNAFARHDLTKERYEEFIKDEKTTVNAGVLYPYDVVHEVSKLWKNGWYCSYELTVPFNDVRRMAVNKYWDNLHDYFENATLNALVVCDTSGSMTRGYGSKSIVPIDVAISLALYTADKAKGPFHNHFISFSSKPKLIETTGVDFCDKVSRIYKQNLCENTNIEATFDLVLNTALRHHLKQSDMPEHIIIVSDMQFDQARHDYYSDNDTKTLMEKIESKWLRSGYEMPKLVFWNVNASSGGGNIPMRDQYGITFVSGASPVIFEMIMTGKTAKDLMLDKLLSDRYKVINSIYEA